MFRNRFLLVLGVISLLLISMAISRPSSNAAKSANLSWPARPVILSASQMNNLSDYYQRHNAPSTAIRMKSFYQKYPGQWVSRAAGVAIPVTGNSAANDYFQRHLDLNAVAGPGIAVDTTDYFVRHAELSSTAKSADLSWPSRPMIIPATGVNNLSDYFFRH